MRQCELHLPLCHWSWPTAAGFVLFYANTNRIINLNGLWRVILIMILWDEASLEKVKPLREHWHEKLMLWAGTILKMAGFSSYNTGLWTIQCCAKYSAPFTLQCRDGEEIQTQNCNTLNINEVIKKQKHSWINKLFSEENKVPEHHLKLERWQGPPHVHKVKHCETVLSFKVQFLRSVYSVTKTMRVCLF